MFNSGFEELSGVSCCQSGSLGCSVSPWHWSRALRLLLAGPGHTDLGGRGGEEGLVLKLHSAPPSQQRLSKQHKGHSGFMDGHIVSYIFKYSNYFCQTFL